MYGDRERTRGRIRQLLTENPSLYRESIAREYAHPVGKKRACLTHPLHDVSDMLFEGTLHFGQGTTAGRGADRVRSGFELPVPRSSPHCESDRRSGRLDAGRHSIFLLAVLSGGGPSLISFPQFSGVSPSPQDGQKQAENEKNLTAGA
jgi:hypothetical protein